MNPAPPVTSTWGIRTIFIRAALLGVAGARSPLPTGFFKQLFQSLAVLG
jgi:hypothetical protein